MSNTNLIPTERIEKSIYLIRGEKVMLDRDLAKLYGVPLARSTRQCGAIASVFQRIFFMSASYITAAFLAPLLKSISLGERQKKYQQRDRSLFNVFPVGRNVLRSFRIYG